MRIYPVKRPLCAAIAAFIVGLWLGSAATLPGMGCAFFAAAIMLIAAAASVKMGKGRLFLACLLALAAGLLLMQQTGASHRALVPLHGSEGTISAHITRAPADRTYVDAEVTVLNGSTLEEPVPVRIQRAWEDDGAYTLRAEYEFTGTFAAPEPATNPGGYDEEKILTQRGIATLFEADAPGTLIADPPAWAQWLNGVRDSYSAILARYLEPGQQALIAATLFGDVSDLNDDFYNVSQQFGIIHIFSVSGLHVSFILAFVLALARLLRRQHSWGLFLLMVPLLTLYTLLSDASAPAVRASIMGLATLLALRLLRYRDPLTIIALAALALLLANPYNLWQIGFQLSFLAMLGLILLTPRFEPFLAFLPKGLASALAVSLAAECVSLPLVAHYFYQVAPLSTLMNLLVVPFFSLLVPLALAALLIAGLLPALGTLVFLPVRMLILVIVALMDIVNNLTGTLHVYIGQPSIWLLLLCYAALIAFCLVPLDAGKLRAGALAAALLCLAVLILRPAVSSDLRLTMVDVGQGTGCTYQTADGHWLVFDTGPGADTVAQYLRYCGANTIDALVLSHSDSDHIGGAAHILRDFHVRQLLASPYAQQSEEWQALALYLDNTEIVTVDAPLTFSLGESRLNCTLLAASSDGGENNNQVVSLLSDDGCTTLFCGDTDSEDLTTIPWTAATDLILVPHHGSKNSWDTDFYRQHSPSLALISAGANNRYGHPHAETTDGLASLDIPALCTANTGAVRVYEQNDALYVRTGSAH